MADLEQALRAASGLAGAKCLLAHRPDCLRIQGNPLCHAQVAAALFPLQIFNPSWQVRLALPQAVAGTARTGEAGKPGAMRPVGAVRSTGPAAARHWWQ